MPTTLAIVLLCFGQIAEPGAPRFVEAAAASGLGGLNAARLCLADVNGDGRPDAVIDRHRVFLNRPDPGSAHGMGFEEVESGLPAPGAGDCCVFADLDNDGRADAVFTRYLDVNSETYEPPAEEPKRTNWRKGNGDGTFGTPREIPAAKEATTAAVAVGDVDRDGLLDLWLGNWYVKYGESNEGFTNDLLLQVPPGRVHRASGPNAFVRLALPEDEETFDEERDAAGRPTYGMMIATLVARAAGDGANGLPELLELNYGRRWNRLWAFGPFIQFTHFVDGSEVRRAEEWVDVAAEAGFAGDDVTHGRYPEWLKERAKTDPRFDRPDEKPFRANGNTFDASVGDIDNDGDWDVFLAEIAHAWAGESSDRSRFLVQESDERGRPRFVSPAGLSVDRVPPEPPVNQRPGGWIPRWNQGDLFCELADLDHDGWLDLILSSGDYPDPAPYDQRLRIFLQRGGGTPEARFEDVTASTGLDHPGSGQIAVGDIDLDGDLDILAGQSFMRWTSEMIAAHPEGEPRVRLFLNQTIRAAADAVSAGEPSSVTLKLVGDPGKGVARDALGAIVRLTTTINGEPLTQSRQLIGIGGHAGKQNEFLVHFGLGDAARAERIEIEWPAAERTTTVLEDVPAGRHTVHQSEPRP